MNHNKKMENETTTVNTEENELNLEDLEKVSGGGMERVYVKDTIDITQSIKDRA